MDSGDYRLNTIGGQQVNKQESAENGNNVEVGGGPRFIPGLHVT